MPFAASARLLSASAAKKSIHHGINTETRISVMKKRKQTTR
jgi:hypothetical protein